MKRKLRNKGQSQAVDSSLTSTYRYLPVKEGQEVVEGYLWRVEIRQVSIPGKLVILEESEIRALIRNKYFYSAFSSEGRETIFC